jgi:8-oxo-dGTP diphosphatase
MKFCYDFPHPSITGDVIVWDRRDDRILLIKRKKDPYANCWAIVGGFFNPGDVNGTTHVDQTVRDAAIRELKEEVNIDYANAPRFGKLSFTFLTIQDKPGRDPRGRVVTMVYVLTIWDGVEGLDIKAQDDALEVQWFPAKDILEGKVPLAFDHLDSIKKFKFGLAYV